MQVKLENVSKVFQNHSVFKNVNHTFESGSRTVVLGGNGSGKSTLLKIISSAMMPSTGNICYENIADEKRFRNVSFCAPYTDLIEDLTLVEHIDFQQKFKPFASKITSAEIVQRLRLERFKNHPLKTYSSGMRQRVRLMLAIASQTPLLLLDEPTSNLDPAGKQWYAELIEDFAKSKTIIVGSNHLEEEYFFTHKKIDIHQYK